MRKSALSVIGRLFLVVSLGWGWSSSYAQPAAAVSEYTLKAALLIKLPRFIYWPERIETKFSLCVLGESPFGDALEELAQNPIDGRYIETKNINYASQAKYCDLLFVAASERTRLKQIFRILNKSAIATVSDIENFAEKGGMVELALVNDGTSLRILINQQAANDRNIKFNAQLLRLAQLVTP